MAPVEIKIRHEDVDFTAHEKVVTVKTVIVPPGEREPIKNLTPATISVHCDGRDQDGFLTFSQDPQFLQVTIFRNQQDAVGLIQKPEYMRFSGEQKIVIKDNFHDDEIELTHKPGPQQPPRQLPPGRDPVRV